MVEVAGLQDGGVRRPAWVCRGERGSCVLMSFQGPWFAGRGKDSSRRGRREAPSVARKRQLPIALTALEARCVAAC